ncbi:MAG TPA: Smr/MutS family protein [Gemmatimonadales bacterium]
MCLDAACSADALATLEFAAVLAVIAERAAGPLAAAALRDRYPTDDAEWILRELGLVGEVLAVLRRGTAFQVAPVPDLQMPLGRLRVEGSVLEVRDLRALRQALAAGREVAAELDRHADACPRVAALRVPPVDRGIERILELAVGDDDELLDTASPALAAARREVHVARERLIRRLESLLRDADPAAVPGGATVTMRSGRYVIPVRRDSRARPDGIIHDESGSAGTLFIEPTAAIELGNALRSALIDEERQVQVVLREITGKLRPVRNEIAALHAAAVTIDTIVARARWACELDAEVPAIGTIGGALTLNDARHPLLLARGIAVIPFTLQMDAAERTLLISGPNTGGKTVLLKAVGLVLALAQSGIVPPVGPETVLPIMRRFFVDIGDHQSLAADLSTFSAHVATLRQVLESADDATLVLLDEVGSGTDPAEGGALAMAVLETLTTRRALTLATTHLGALKTLAARVPGVVNGSLHFDAATLSPTYRFTKGVPGRSYGLAIARRLGIDARVLAAAEALVPEAERELDRLLAAVEARSQQVERQATLLDTREVEVEQREAVARVTDAAQEARDLALRQAEKHAERDRARQAKAYLLEARKRVDQALSLAQGAADEAAAREARRLVEEGVREQAQLLDESGDAVVAADGAAVQVGSRVRLTTGAMGDVVELRNDGKAVVLLGTMRLVVAARTLTAVAKSAATGRPRATRIVVDETPRDMVSELDLRGLRADEADALVRSAIDSAVLADQPQLAIIHGMGTGVLRDLVRGLLAADGRVASFDFAPRPQGGLGVTIAVLR